MNDGQAKVLGARIRQARRSIPTGTSRHVSQEAFATRLGVHWVTVSSWERGKNPPSLDNLVRISEETGQPLAHFLETDEEDEEAAMQTIDGLLRLQVRRLVAEELRKAVA